MTAETNAPEVTKLYRGIFCELRSLLLSKIVNTVQADDIALQTFLKLRWFKYHRDIQDLRRYLSNIALRLVINLLRKRRSLQSAEMPNTKVGVIAQAYLVLLDELKNEALKDSIEGPLDKTSMYVYCIPN